ncbi:MAG: glycosyl transferase family protein [Parcubacteria group bacterium LiPW_15]|nr:MAG: glycosyl transferase family protein [Parcubacteria group bacterium LiPW_15]
MKPSISLIILTYNEEANLPKCLKSVEGLAAEIVIVDSGSTDKTKEIAEKFGAKFIVHEFKNQADQFNWALANIELKGDWILRLDADEELLPELKEEIRAKLPDVSEDVCGLYLNRRNYFKGAWIKHGGYYPIWILRLFRKGAAKSEEREMDEHLVLLRGRAEKLANDFIDNNLKGLEEWKAKHRKYAMREARAYLAHEDGKEVGGQAGAKRKMKLAVYYRVPPFLRVILYFLYRYFILLGFLDGWRGTQFHLLQGFWYRWLIDFNIVKLQHAAKS